MVEKDIIQIPSGKNKAASIGETNTRLIQMPERGDWQAAGYRSLELPMTSSIAYLSLKATSAQSADAANPPIKNLGL